VTISLETIRRCLEGAVPAAIATCAPDGTPNIALLSQVHFVDGAHVALSFQFFNKTRENVLAHPHALVQVVDPDDATHYRLSLQYLRTETEGPLFESMKAKLAGIASHSGMSKVFRLQGSDVYRVLDIERVPGTQAGCAEHRRVAVGAVRQLAQELARHRDLDGLLEAVLLNLETLFDMRHSMVLMHDEAGQCLYTVASRGYAASGVGSEIALGEGVIGVAARQRTPIRINHMAREYLYSHAVRRSMASDDPNCMLESEIPLPGLPESHSQLAVPILLGDRLLGVLYTESPQDMRFTYEDEDALVALASHLAMAMRVLELSADRAENGAAGNETANALGGAPVVVRHYAANDSVFIGDDYLIKGVAGAIFWKLLRDFVDHKRTEYTNRELRLDETLRLPDICDNLEARLILLQRRLHERCAFLRIEKTGRGRFRLVVERALRLEENSGAAR
jgi:adenylate cyclase